MCRSRLDANKAFIALQDPGIGGNSSMDLNVFINMWRAFSVYLLYFLSLLVSKWIWIERGRVIYLAKTPNYEMYTLRPEVRYPDEGD